MQKNLLRTGVLALLPLAVLAALTPLARGEKPARPTPVKSSAPRTAKHAARKPAASKPTPIVWQKNLNKALKLAKQQRKMIMVDFYTDWCGWCKVLDRRVYTDAKIQTMARKFIPVKLNPETDGAAGALAQQIGVTSFPSIVFITQKGHPVYGIRGYREAPDFLRQMQHALTLAQK